jgi:hypothetical protein
MLSLFLRITALVAIGLIALFVLLFVVKVLFVAALVAALAVGGIVLYNVVRRRRIGASPISRTAPRW